MLSKRKETKKLFQSADFLVKHTVCCKEQRHWYFTPRKKGTKAFLHQCFISHIRYNVKQLIYLLVNEILTFWDLIKHIPPHYPFRYLTDHSQANLLFSPTYPYSVYHMMCIWYTDTLCMFIFFLQLTKMLTFPLCGCELSSESKTLAFAAPLVSISHTKRQIVLGRRDSVKVSAAKSGNFSLGSVRTSQFNNMQKHIYVQIWCIVSIDND